MKMLRLIKTACVVLVLQLVADAVDIDPLEMDIDNITSIEQLAAVEATFAELAEIQGLLKNSRRCFHQIVNEELRRLHENSPLRRTEFLRIESDVRFATRKAVLDIGQDQLSRMQLHKAGSTAGNSFGRLAPVTNVENFVLDAAEQHLGDLRVAPYREEVDNRRQSRKAAVTNAITASLDSRLFLSTEQRDNIAKLLQREWHDPWLLCLRQLLIRGVEAIPLLPDRQIADELTPAQKTLYSSLRWNPTRPPYVGPSSVIMAGHKNRDVRMVEVLKFTLEDEGSEQ